MKKLLISLLCISILTSCNRNKTDEAKVSKSNFEINTNYTYRIEGEMKNIISSKVYLNKIQDSILIPVDSSIVENNRFYFEGEILEPERVALTFLNYPQIAIFILENLPLTIEINEGNINDPLVYGSPLNSLLTEYKTHSKNIFKKIDNLYPAFQKARLENDVEKLRDIRLKMKAVELEFNDFTYSFIENHKSSKIAPMLLRDQLKSSNIDSIKILNMFNMLPDEIKNTPDAKSIKDFFNLKN